MKECFICKSTDIVQSTTPQTYEENGHIVVIRSVPCLQCRTCGETYLSTDTMRHIESFLNTVSCAEVEIVSYSMVAA